jgi:hypothetical protein
MRIVHRAERIERKPYHPPSFENFHLRQRLPPSQECYGGQDGGQDGGTGESTRRRLSYGGQAKNQKHPPPLKLRRAGEREKASFGRRSTGLSGCKSFIQVTEVD